MRKIITLEIEELFCDVCKEDLRTRDGFPFVTNNGKDYCPECAYKAGAITKKEWAHMHGLYWSDRNLKSLEVI